MRAGEALKVSFIGVANAFREVNRAGFVQSSRSGAAGLSFVRTVDRLAFVYVAPEVILTEDVGEAVSISSNSVERNTGFRGTIAEVQVGAFCITFALNVSRASGTSTRVTRSLVTVEVDVAVRILVAAAAFRDTSAAVLVAKKTTSTIGVFVTEVIDNSLVFVVNVTIQSVDVAFKVRISTNTKAIRVFFTFTTPHATNTSLALAVFNIGTTNSRYRANSFTEVSII